MKSRISQTLALALSLCMLVGCGNSASDSKSVADANKVSGTETSSADVAEENNSEVQSQYPEYLNLDSYRPIVKDDEEITLKVAIVRDGTATSNANELWFKKFIEEKLNINLEIEEIAKESVEERKSLMMASNDMPDLICGIGFSNAEIVKYGVEGGQLLAMSDYMSEELTPNMLAFVESNQAAKAAYTANDGKMYTVPFLDKTDTGFGNTIGIRRVFIDTTFMDAAGITEAPETLDGFVDMLRAFKELDPAALGVDTVWPLISVGSYDGQMFQNAFGWVSKGNLYAPCWDVETEEVVVPALTEKFAEYIKLYHTLYSEGLIHPDYYTLDETAKRALFAGKQCGVVGDHAPYLSIPDHYDDFISVPALTTEYSPNGIVTSQDGFWDALTFINADTDYPELIMRLLDYFCTPEGIAYQYYGPMEGSEDTLGVVQGFKYDEEEKKIVIGDVLSGKYSDEYDYQVNALWLIQRMPTDRSKSREYATDMLGVEMEEAKLDLTNPDDHYRYICNEADEGHLEYVLPGIYAGEEEMSRFTDLQSTLTSYGKSEMAKFVVGERPIEEVDQLSKELLEMGGDEFLELCKEFYRDYTR